MAKETLFQTNGYNLTSIMHGYSFFMTLSMVMYTVHMTSQDIDSGASAPVGPSVATPLDM